MSAAQLRGLQTPKIPSVGEFASVMYRVLLGFVPQPLSVDERREKVGEIVKAVEVYHLAIALATTRLRTVTDILAANEEQAVATDLPVIDNMLAGQRALLETAREGRDWSRQALQQTSAATEFDDLRKELGVLVEVWDEGMRVAITLLELLEDIHDMLRADLAIAEGLPTVSHTDLRARLDLG